MALEDFKIELFKTYPALIVVFRIEAPVTAKEEAIRKLVVTHLKEKKSLGEIANTLSPRISMGKVQLQGIHVWFAKVEFTSNS